MELSKEDFEEGKCGFYGIVKAAMGLGMKGLVEDLGVEVEVQVNTDSSAAKSISSRRGAGRVRHVEVRELWVQESSQRRDVYHQSPRRGECRRRLD